MIFFLLLCKVFFYDKNALVHVWAKNRFVPFLALHPTRALTFFFSSMAAVNAIANYFLDAGLTKLRLFDPTCVLGLPPGEYEFTRRRGGPTEVRVTLVQEGEPHEIHVISAEEVRIFDEGCELQPDYSSPYERELRKMNEDMLCEM